MPNQKFPSSVPVCDNIEEKEEEFEKAKEDQRPFLAVTDEEDLPGWRAVYMMDSTGEGRENWYYLTDSAVDEVEEHRSQFEQYLVEDSWVSSCSNTEGELHGLSKDDAKALADRFADVVWDEDNWKEVTPREIFYGDY